MTNNGQVETEVPPTEVAVTAAVESLNKRVRTLEAWDDRLGSTLKRAWHQRVMIAILLVIVGLLAWDKLKIRPEVLPYLYVVDPGGDVLWQGVPGSYTIHDPMVMNHLEEWIEWVRSRPDDATLITLWKAWDKAVKMTVKDSQARAVFSEYMTAEDPRKVNPKPRVEVRMLTKKPLVSSDGVTGQYRLSWQETSLGTAGQVLRQPTWEADITVELHPPTTRDEAQKTNRYGVMITHISWSEVSRIGG